MKLQQGLVGHWTMDDRDTSDGTLYDGSAFDNNGALNGAPTTGASGKVDKTYSFDGSDDEVVVSDDPSLDIENEVTVSVWINPDAQTSQGQDVVGKSDAYGFHIYHADDDGTAGRIYSDIWIDGTRVNPPSGLAEIDVWNNFVVTYDGSTVSVYKNGDFTNGESASGTIDVTSLNFGIGGGGFPLGRGYFLGQIDDVRVYNRALSEDEINELYQMREQRNRKV